MRHIYSISDPVSKDVFYIGISGNVDARAKQHYAKGGLCYEKIQGLMKNGITPEFKTLQVVDDKKHCPLSLEKEWIFKMLSFGHKLLNIVHNPNNIIMKNKIKKERKSKYGFSSRKPGDSFLCKASDYNSMLTSLRQFNKRNETDMKVSAENTSRESLLLIKIL